jgi:two-component system chemotaxis response regulator CheB
VTALPSTSPAEPIRVLLVDDSSVVRGLTSRWLGAAERIVVAGVATDGESAVREAERLQPDVIVLDVEMPRMTGIEALPLLRRVAPGARVIMASTLTRRGGEVTIRCLAAGAADYIAKPESSGLGGADTYRRDLIAKIEALGVSRRRAVAPVQGAPVGRPAVAAGPSPRTPVMSAASAAITLVRKPAHKPDLLVVGSSTGGPHALQVFLGQLVGKLTVPVLVVQHMPRTFTEILASHLASSLGVPCREARHGDRPQRGEVLVAPGDHHLRVRRQAGSLSLTLDQDSPVNFCRPAVDPLFQTAAEACEGRVLGVVLTGMGADGREGARRIVELGGRVLVQDEATSVVWGMPGAVAKAGFAAAVEPLDQLGHLTVKYIEGAQP